MSRDKHTINSTDAVGSAVALAGEAAVAGHPVEVHAVGAMAGAGRWSGPELVQRIQEATQQAVLSACEEGFSVSDPEHVPEFRARIMAARQAVLDHGRELNELISKLETAGDPPPASPA